MRRRSGVLITEYMIQRELKDLLVSVSPLCVLPEGDGGCDVIVGGKVHRLQFEAEDLTLSLDDFSRKYLVPIAVKARG